MMNRIIALTCALLMLCSTALAEASLEKLLYYEYCLNSELEKQPDFNKADLIFEQPEANQAYIERVLSHAQTLNEVQEVNGLRFTALRAVAVNDLYILEWDIENISGEPRLLAEQWMLVNGMEAQNYTDGGLSGRVLLAGERAQAVAASQVTGLEGDTCALSMEYYELSIDESLIPEDRTQPIEIDEENAEILCSETFAVQLARAFEEPVFQLTEPVEREWQNSILRVTEVRLDISGGTMTMMRIFDTEEEALRHNPVGQEGGWDFMMVDGTDEEHNFWYSVSTGYVDDQPVKLEDGRYAYRFNRAIGFLNYFPESLNLVPRTPGEDGQFAYDWEAAIHFDRT